MQMFREWHPLAIINRLNYLPERKSGKQSVFVKKVQLFSNLGGLLCRRKTWVIGGHTPLTWWGSSSSLIRIGLSATDSVLKPLQIEGEESVYAWSKTTSTFKSASIQGIYMSSRSDSWYPLASMFCGVTFESGSSLILCVMCSLLVGSIWCSSQMCVLKFLFLGQQRFPSCQVTFMRTYCLLLDKIFQSLNQKISLELERPWQNVFEDWEDHVAWRSKKCVQIEIEVDVPALTMKQWALDTCQELIDFRL